MSYKIKKVDIVGTSIVTKVDFTFSDNSIKGMNLTHFQPLSVESVITSIENFEANEEKRITLPDIIASVKAELDDLIS